MQLMITLANIRDFLKRFDLFEHYYIGKLDNKQDKSLGVYSLKRNEPPVTAIGTQSTYDIIGVSLLIHWNNNADETEITARQLFEYLRTVKKLRINNTQVYMIQLLMPEPVDVGTDDKGIYERVIEMKIYYERKI
ncbi:MAG: minor capsid protein [Ruminococcus sp.]|nr:minor capsid protein [Ruminococcus sp.]